MMEALGRENITANKHHKGIPPEQFQANKGLNAFFSVLATSEVYLPLPLLSELKLSNVLTQASYM